MVMAKKARIKIKELEDLVDVFEGAYMFVQPRPETVGIEKDYIHVSYDGLRTVKPLTHSDLFTSFAKLPAHGEPSEAKIKRWVARFGLPVRGSRPERKGVELRDKMPEYEPMSMTVEEFRREARFAHELFHLYSLIRGEDVTAIKSAVRALRSNKKEPSELDSSFLEAFQANKHTLLLNNPEDNRRSNFREAVPVSRGEPGIRGAKARHRQFDEMITLLSAQSAIGEITTEIISEVRLRVGVQWGEGSYSVC